jgi:hypothetical protein
METPLASGTERPLGPATLVAESRQLEAGGPPLFADADGVVRHRRVFSSGEVRPWARILHQYRAGGDGKLIALRVILLWGRCGRVTAAIAVTSKHDEDRSTPVADECPSM